MNESNKNGISVKTIVIFAAVLLIAVAATVLIVMNVVGKPASPRSGAPELEANQTTGVAIGDGIEKKKNKEPGVKIPGWGIFKVTAGETQTNINLYNPEGNADRFYLTFEIKIPEENGEYKTIYKSGLIEPGNSVKNIVLNEPLEAGEYEGIVHVQPYTMGENPAEVNNADMRTKIVVS